MKKLNSVREFLIQYYQEQAIHLGGLLEEKSKEFKKVYVPQIVVKKVPLPEEEKILSSDFKNREKKQEQKPNSKLIKSVEITPEDFFNQNLKPQIIVITGESGLGKTSYCQNLLKQWSQNQLWKEKFDEVIYLSMQNLISLPKKFLGDNHSLEEILNKEFTNDFVQKIYPTLQKKIQESPDRILLILEGYDEKPIRRDLEKSIDALFKKFPQVLITSRPGYFTKYNNTFLELCSFTENQIENYLNGVNQKKLINFLKINPNLKNLAKIPLLLEMICDIWTDNGPEIKQVQTLTQLYVKIISKIEKRLTEELVKKNPSIKSLESKAQEVLEVLEQLAFVSMHQYIKGNALQEHLKLILDKNYLYDSQTENIRNLLLRTGLIRCVVKNLDNPIIRYSFVHPSFQEFFAARYLARIFNTPIEQQNPVIIQWLSTQKYQRFYQQMLVFLSNLLHSTNWHNFLKKMVDESPFDLTGLHHDQLYMRLLKEKDWSCIELQAHFQKIHGLFRKLISNTNGPYDEDYCFSITCTLVDQNPKWGIQILKNLLTDEKENFFIREEAIKILTIVTPEFLMNADAECIINLLPDKHINKILETEGAMGSDKIHQYHYLRSVAARGLGIIGSEMPSKEIILALKNLLLSDYANTDETTQSLWSIEQLALAKTTSEAIREVIPILIDQLKKTDESIEKQLLIRVLGLLGSKFVNDVLSDRIVEALYLALSDETTKNFAIEAFTKLNPGVINNQVINALLKILKEDYFEYIEDIGLIIGKCAQAGVLKELIKKNIPFLIALLSPLRPYLFYQKDFLKEMKQKRGIEIITWTLSHLTPDAINDKSVIAWIDLAVSLRCHPYMFNNFPIPIEKLKNDIHHALKQLSSQHVSPEMLNAVRTKLDDENAVTRSLSASIYRKLIPNDQNLELSDTQKVLTEKRLDGINENKSIRLSKAQYFDIVIESFNGGEWKHLNLFFAKAVNQLSIKELKQIIHSLKEVIQKEMLNQFIEKGFHETFLKFVCSGIDSRNIPVNDFLIYCIENKILIQPIGKDHIVGIMINSIDLIISLDQEQAGFAEKFFNAMIKESRRNQYNNFYRPKSIQECLIAFPNETASKQKPIPTLLPLSVILSKASPPIPKEFKGDYELKLMRQEIFNHGDFSKINYLASSIGIPCCTFLRLLTTSPYHDSGTESPELANTYYRTDRSIHTKEIGNENFFHQTKSHGKKKLKGADLRHLGDWHHNEEALKLRSRRAKEQKNDDRGDGHLYNALLNYKNEICLYIVNRYNSSSGSTSTIVPGFYNEYPCVMVYTPLVLKPTSRLYLTTKKSWTKVIMCFFTGLMNFIAFKQQGLPLELVIRPSFSFLTPTISETGESFRLSVGIIPKEYADVLVQGLVILNRVLINLKTEPEKFDQKLPDDIYRKKPEYQTYIGQDKTQSSTSTETTLSLLTEKVEKNSTGKTAITNLVRTFAMQAALIIHFYQKLCQATHIDDQACTHLFVETLGWGLNHAGVNKTQLSIKPPELQKIMTEPLAKSKEINDQKFWELIKNISKTLSQGLTTKYSLKLAKRVEKSGHRLNKEILELARTKKIDELYYNLEKLNELIHVQSIIEPYGDESDSYGSESDEAEDETNIYRKKIIVENGMASIIGACQGAIRHCTKMASEEEEHPKILTYKLYFESKEAWKLLKLNRQVEEIKEIEDFIAKLEKNRTTDARKTNILMLDSNPVITDGKECQPPLEIAKKTPSNKVLIVDSTSSTLETYQKWIDLFENKDHIEILMFVSSGLKNEQVGADNNPHGTIRVFARQESALNDVLDYIKSIKKPILIHVAHYRRRLYKRLGGTPRNNLILKNAHPIVQKKNSKKRKLTETSNSTKKLASPSTTAPKYATFTSSPSKSTNNQSNLSSNFNY